MALRTLRQLPKAVGETAGGEPIYEVKSVQLLLDSSAGNFVRLAECSRCGRQLAGAPVLTPADLDRPLRPMICTDCIRSAAVSTVWESEGGGPAQERPGPVTLAAGHQEPAATAPADAQQPDRLHVVEGHLRAVTDRVNELGRVARAHQADIKERSRREEATAAALRDELAALRASTDGTRAELQRLAVAHAEPQGLAEVRAELQRLAQADRQNTAAGQAEPQSLADVHAELQRLAGNMAELERRAETPPAAEAGAGLAQLRDEVAQLARLVEAQRGEVIGFVAAVGETQIATTELAAAQEGLAATLAALDPSKVEQLIATRVAQAEARLAEALAPPPPEVDLTKVEELIATRLADAEGRIARRMAGQGGDLKAAVEAWVTAYMAGFVRANEKLAGGQAVLDERIETLADQLSEASRRLDGMLDRLAALDAAVRPLPAGPAEVANDSPAGTFLDSLDRQLEAAARRLASRSQAGAGRGEP